MKEKKKVEQDKQVLHVIQREIDIITALLLLTGQYTIFGIFVEPGSFSLSVGGPITGTSRIVSKSGDKTVDLTIDAIDILLAILLISDKVNINGIFISPRGFSLSIGGPLFGGAKPEPDLPHAEKIFNEFNKIL
ncbi:hypothetical protein BTO30_11245 [Domibacillus antri]|uniref:Uncharacterized protein n=1 Tax=Domibacillus antri TaxID=1714264 RepID=A0A1Q8Q4B6_9BACI|nr:hypothetical protein [Domibacillus antri]OLN22142.1 hypothetical protein BTO30_11245 [Domibacillus antri]